VGYPSGVYTELDVGDGGGSSASCNGLVLSYLALQASLVRTPICGLLHRVRRDMLVPSVSLSSNNARWSDGFARDPRLPWAMEQHLHSRSEPNVRGGVVSGLRRGTELHRELSPPGAVGTYM
jgi:hypothetical protein